MNEQNEHLDFDVPDLKPSDSIIVATGPEVPKANWTPAIVTQVFPDQGSCHALLFMPGGTRTRFALHYVNDPRLKDNPQWLPSQEPDSGVWDLSRKESLARSNQKLLEELQQTVSRLAMQLVDAARETKKEMAELRKLVERSGVVGQPVRRGPGRPPRQESIIEGAGEEVEQAVSA